VAVVHLRFFNPTPMHGPGRRRNSRPCDGLRAQGLPVHNPSFSVVVVGVEDRPPLSDLGRALRRRPTLVLRGHPGVPLWLPHEGLATPPTTPPQDCLEPRTEGAWAQSLVCSMGVIHQGAIMPTESPVVDMGNIPMRPIVVTVDDLVDEHLEGRGVVEAWGRRHRCGPRHGGGAEGFRRVRSWLSAAGGQNEGLNVNDTELIQRGGYSQRGDGANGQSLRSPPSTPISKDIRV